MPQPMTFKEGIIELQRELSGSQAVIVDIPHRSSFEPFEFKSQEPYLGALKRYLPAAQVIQYVPPNDVGSKARSVFTMFAYSELPPREEVIPTIPDPNLIYVFIDDIFHFGHTLDSAVNALSAQGANKLWFMAGDIIGLPMEAYLDRVEVYKQFRKARPIKTGF
jgi:hypothetical protein